jgi:HD-like signal output (HDOD) protein
MLYVEQVNEIVTSLEKQKTSNKSKESEKQHLWEKTMYTWFFVKN